MAELDINKLLRYAFEKRASDLHITSGSAPIFRLDGELRRLDVSPLMPPDTEAIAREVMGEELFQSFKDEGEADFSYGIAGVSRFRVNAYHQRKSISLVFRVIPTEIPTLEKLNMPKILEKLCHKPQGLVLVTGPTGSGKSTTLAAMLDYINRNMRKHIITLEDPIEYLHRHKSCIVNQREIGFDTVDFATGLRASLRQDPDVILVGEMRDLETISTAITAAETGHLVFATLHTPDAPQTIDRIIDVFPGPQQPQMRIQLASVLLSVVSQRLFPKVGGGRIAATEILVNTPAVSNLIRMEKVHQIRSIMQTGREMGMHTLEMSINELIAQGALMKETVKNYLNEKVLE
ncbi:type IV pilus twitching motility protein PilT [Aneurinibacillus migulanus]|uniref:Twitching motility protein PilT n=1 Tax=Aneurinibacillus migulanus TaxID=47500 RepID=A0A0D1W322_ANEMI|nr:type IV pilus twitching motility protein PilT [Aneurinibacillus migulanus]KIV52820.1 twitching motility protein PilT [Aneurinibacillus migulanus]KON95090.1 twitching motility protein PilT [Aneurinibacillus migulanus]MED0895772.1 type IV pilus twitching motility protein PilT [Aneurinibacillus migulanus]MED1614877.1 type IV pilus twitching motility protein PilT [Aneurinibacillus migulanus]SDJ40927.1 twitching motility protein PilT [Aneurinibacillus migulanus]